jgi:hypothetical protein
MLFGLVADRSSSRRAVEAMIKARRSGAGVYTYEWQFADATMLDAVAEPLLAWCRDTLSRTRRPWGIAHFDLALAVRGEHASRPRTLSLRRMDPVDLYPGDVLVAQLRRLIEAEQAVAHVAVALFSWGDAAHAALPQT